MCHLILLMPVLALPIFWLMPPNSATPIYIVIVLISGLLYWVIRRAMRKPIQDGFQSLIGDEAEVVSRLGPDNYAKYLVRAGGELWTARCPDVLQPGETVNIAALDGISLVVERRNNDSHPNRLSGVKAKKTGANHNERHCY